MKLRCFAVLFVSMIQSYCINTHVLQSKKKKKKKLTVKHSDGNGDFGISIGDERLVWVMEISLHLREREAFSLSLSRSLAHRDRWHRWGCVRRIPLPGTVLPDSRVFNIVARCCIYSTKNHSFSPRARMIRGISCASTLCRLTRIKCRP